jgi:hypothetical protein
MVRIDHSGFLGPRHLPDDSGKLFAVVGLVIPNPPSQSV